ncbi:MAG: T9SS type A sorting domain-containing protein [Ignavibacteriaceae bacterium]
MGSKQTTTKVYDFLGSEVAILVDKLQQPGNYEIEFNAFDLSSGIYFYQLRFGNFIQTKNMVLLK